MMAVFSAEQGHSPTARNPLHTPVTSRAIRSGSSWGKGQIIEERKKRLGSQGTGQSLTDMANQIDADRFVRPVPGTPPLILSPTPSVPDTSHWVVIVSSSNLRDFPRRNSPAKPPGRSMTRGVCVTCIRARQAGHRLVVQLQIEPGRPW